MRNASMKVLKNLVCCAAFICLMFVLAMPAHAASKADELLQLVNAERAQAGVAPLSMGSSALNAAAQARAKELTVNYSYNRPNGSREFTILPEYGVDDVSVGENYWAAAENASDVVAAWNRYDFFKERMLDKDATSVGIGYYEGGEYGNYWVMIFTYARGTSENGFAQEVLALVNAERAKENLAPLAMGDAKLQAAADERDAALIRDRDAMARAGLSEREIVTGLALKYHLSDRHVWRVLHRVPEGKTSLFPLQRQGRLL